MQETEGSGSRQRLLGKEGRWESGAKPTAITPALMTHRRSVSRALADPARLRIYEAIAARDGVDCGELVELAGLAPGTVSHHLKVLAEAHLIVSRRDESWGQFIHQHSILKTMERYTKALTRLSRRR